MLPPFLDISPTVEELVLIQQAQLQHHLRQLQIEQQVKLTTKQPVIQLSIKNSTARPQANVQPMNQIKEEIKPSIIQAPVTPELKAQTGQQVMHALNVGPQKANQQMTKQQLVNQQLAQIPNQQLISRQFVQQPVQVFQIPLQQLTQIPLMLHHHGQQVVNLAVPVAQQHPIMLQHIHQPLANHVARTRPRIVGPRLQRPSAKTSSEDKKELAESDRPGVCPGGNQPLMDEETGRLRLCNGLEPHCPPKSYCYVTGVASQTYNCCTV